jgi:hypothetical protein
MILIAHTLARAAYFWTNQCVIDTIPPYKIMQKMETFGFEQNTLHTQTL